MLSYRHAFHAGAAADVLKHSVLVQCLDYMGQKEKGYTYIDTHAGAGLYHLDEGFSAQNKEWLSGTGKVFSAFNKNDEIKRDEKSGIELLDRYEEIISPFWQSSKSYPGSCLIAAQVMRQQDKAFCYELHPRDYELLDSQFENDKRFKIIKADGPKEMVSLLPPSTRRGCILIDPSYEIKSDYIDLQKYIAAALKRFSTGIYIIWYPLLAREDVRQIASDFPNILMNLFDENLGSTGSRCRIEIQFEKKSSEERGMYGCGLIMYNPPWILKSMLERDLPMLDKLLDGTSFLEWQESIASCNL
jgi:23S rRNA (adenine2030-N6)-methyltransferase